MADRSIGTVFVELDLDPSRYTKAQQTLLRDATSTSLNIEQNFKNLGVKSSAEMDLMRQKITNSFEMIANSSKATTNDIIRAEEAKNAKIQALNEQQFGKQTTFVENMKANWIGASAAMAAAWALVNKAVDYMDEGAKALQVTSSFKIIAAESGVMADDMIANMARATKGTVDDSDMMQKAVKLMLAGYKPDQIEAFSEVAITASQYMGTTVSESFERISDALASRMPKALVKAGAVTKEQMSVVQDAIKAGATQSDLMALAIDNLRVKQLRLQGTQDGAALAMQRFHAQVNETKESIGVGLINVVQKLYGDMQYLAAGALGLVSGFARLDAAVYSLRGNEQKAAEWTEIANTAWAARNDLIKKAITNMTGEGEVEAKASAQSIAAAQAKVAADMERLKSIAATKAAAEESAKAQEAAAKQLTEAIRKQNVDIDGFSQGQYEKDMIRLDSESAEWLDKTKNKVLVAEWESNELQKIEHKFKEDQVKASKEYQKQMDDMQKSILKGEKETAAEVAKFNKEKFTAERQVYKDISKYAGDYYDSEIKLINEQAAAYKKKGVDQVAIAAWVAEETRKAEYKKAEYSNDFFEGVSAGYAKMKTEAMTLGKAGIETFKTFSSSSATALSTGLFDAIKTGTVDAGKIFTTFGDTMLKKFTDIVAQMVVVAVTDEIVMSFGASWTDGASSVLSTIGKVLGYASDWFFGDSEEGYASGGYVKGYASGGNSPANDTVRAWLSPGEYVVDRERIQAIASQGKNGDTTLAHINPAEAALLKALGGSGTINERTGLPQFYQSYDDYLATYKATHDLSSYVDGNGDADTTKIGQTAAKNYLIEAIVAGKLKDALAYVDPAGYPLNGSLGKFTTDDPTYYPKKYKGWQPWYGAVGVPIIDYNKDIFDLCAYEGGVGNDGDKRTGGTFLVSPADYFRMVKVKNDATSFIPSDIYGNAWPNPYAAYGYNDLNMPDFDPYTGQPWSEGLKNLQDYNTAYFSQFSVTAGGGTFGSIFKGVTMAVIAALTAGYASLAFAGAGIGGAASFGAELGVGSTQVGAGAALLGGAVGGVVGSIPLAQEQQSLMPLLFGAGAGAIGGYLLGGASELTLSDIMESTVGAAVKKYALSKALETVFPSAAGTANITSEGVSGGDGLMSMLKSAPGQMSSNYAFSAKNGLDYVPRDNFLINAHEGEAVLTKEENAQRLSGENSEVLYQLLKINTKMLKILDRFQEYNESDGFRVQVTT